MGGGKSDLIIYRVKALHRTERKPLNRTTARNAALINQFGTPGLGSLIAGRYVMGTGQLILFLAGFCLFVAWFIRLMGQVYAQVKGGAETEPRSIAWMGELGALLAVLAWFWALFTSLALLRAARKIEQSPDESV